MSEPVGAVRAGQQFDPSDNVLHRFTKQVVGYEGPETLRVTTLEGQASTEIMPDDRGAATITTYDLAAIQADLDAIVRIGPGVANLTPKLPEILTGVTITYNKTTGVGSDSHPAANQGFTSTGTSVGGSSNPHASAQGSAAIIPVVLPLRKRYEASNVPSVNYFFYLPENATLVDLKAKLATAPFGSVTALDWPKFRPETVVLVAKGMQVTVHADASSAVSFHAEGLSQDTRTFEYGSGSSSQVGVDTQFVEIPPTIHAAITLSSTSDTANASATVDASTKAITFDGGTVVAAIPNAPATTTQTATGSVMPTTIPATNITAIPVTGLYINDINRGDTHFGRTLYHVELVDFGYFA